MNKWKRIALVAFIAALCVASLAMNASALYISPDGRSGVNYLAVTNPTSAVIGYRSIDSQGQMTVRNPVAGATTELFSNDSGTITSAWLNRTNNPATNYIPATRWYIVIESAENFVRYCAPNRYYYGNAKAHVQVQLLNGERLQYETEAKLTFNWDRQTDGFHATTFTTNQIDQMQGPFSVIFDFDVPEIINGEYVLGVMPYGTYIDKILLLQDNPSNYSGSDSVTTWYVPFNSAYFTNASDNDYYNLGYVSGIEYGYQEGYEAGIDDGFLQGAESAGGTPIQKWGAFLLTAVTGFLDFEIFPGFPLWALLGAVIAIPLTVVFLRMFAGG